jgi:tetratricopeptide (TPR) repeat protein
MYVEVIIFFLMSLTSLSLIENQNNDLDFLMEQAITSLNNLDYESALLYYNEILKQDPNNYSVLNNKGSILLKLERYEEALKIFEKAIEINPKFVEAINNKGITLINLNQKFDALSTFYQAYRIDPENSITIKNMGLIVESMPFLRENGYAKIEIRTSDDQLVGYTQAHRLAVQYPLAGEWLDNNAKWNPVEINGEELEVVQFTRDFEIKESGLYALTKLALDEGTFGVEIIEIVHNGFLVKQDDKVSVELILLRSP